MPKRTSKKQPSDVNLLASSIVRAATEQKPAADAIPKKNPAAVILGRLGGLKGGKARAKSLTPRERSKIARRAAQIRWKKAGS